jgi:hypothetical protein
MAHYIEARDGESRSHSDESEGRKTFAQSLANFPLTTSMCQRSCGVTPKGLT